MNTAYFNYNSPNIRETKSLMKYSSFSTPKTTLHSARSVTKINFVHPSTTVVIIRLRSAENFKQALFLLLLLFPFPVGHMLLWREEFPMDNRFQQKNIKD